MIEFYQAFAVYQDLMDLTEEMMRMLAIQLFGHASLTYQGETYDLEAPFHRLSVKQSVVEYNAGLKLEDLDNLETIRSIADSLGVEYASSDGVGMIQFAIFEKTVEHQLRQPTFITHYPTEVSPLARRNDQDPSVTDRFEFFVGGREIANGFSELNDSEDQADRFRKQVEAKDQGDHEAMHFDADYIRALEYGMPPTAGEGIGIDRLVMLFTDSASIRDVLLFPHMRPEH
jgi:lysyl-tRNA synthetase class 2